MGRIPENTIEKIIGSNDIVDVVSEFVQLKKAGRGYSGVCPFHSDKGPSLSVSPEKQLYHCFGCGASGNVVGFIMRIRNLDFKDAIEYLADRVGIKIVEEDNNPQKARENEFKNKIFKINIDTAKYFYSNLANNKVPLEYFKNRGVDERIIKKFGLGYSSDSWDGLHRYLKSKGYEDELIFNAGLISKKEKAGYYDKFRNRVMFPVFDIKGRVIGFGGRVLDDSKPKYLNSPETPVFVKGTNLYGLNFVIKSGLPENIIIVEGYMDCISLHQFGITNAVASLGTALTLEQAKLLKRYSRDIFICYDSDSAGQAATLRGLDILKSVGCNVRVILIPKGKDPDEFLKNNGREEFLKLVNNAISVENYRIIKAKEGKNLKDASEKSKFVSEAAKILSNLENEIEIQAFGTKIFDETGIDIKIILDEVKNIRNNKINNKNNNDDIRNNNTSGNFYNLDPAYKKSERGLLNIAQKGNEYFKYIKGKIKPEDFITESYKKAGKTIYEMLDNGQEISSSTLLINLEKEHEINDIAMIFEENIIVTDVYKLIDDFVKTIMKFKLEGRINDLTVEIKKYEKNNELDKSAALFDELIMLQKKLSML